MVLQVLYSLIVLFIAFLWVRFIFGWVLMFAPRWTPSGLVLVALEGVYTTTDPPIKGLRRVVPSLQLGPVRLDLSFLLVMVIAWLLLNVVGTLMTRV